MSRVIGRRIGQTAQPIPPSSAATTTDITSRKAEVTNERSSHTSDEPHESISGNPITSPTQPITITANNLSQLTLTPSRSDSTLPLDPSTLEPNIIIEDTQTHLNTEVKVTPSSSLPSISSTAPHTQYKPDELQPVRQLELSSPFLINSRSPNANGNRSRSGSDLPLIHEHDQELTIKARKIASPLSDWDQRKEDIIERTFNVNESSEDEEEGEATETTVHDHDSEYQDQAESGNIETDNTINSSSLFCPICEEEMITLNQLNRHIDDVHLNPNATTMSSRLPSAQRTLKQSNSGLFASPLSADQSLDTISSLINKKTNEYKAKLQDINLPKQLQSKLDSLLLDNGYMNPIQLSSNETNSSSQAKKQHPIEITRRHWQKQKNNQRCSYLPHCQYTSILNLKTGIIHCRHCGKIFCHEHTRYHCKLTEDADYVDHTSGASEDNWAWARVCRDCYVGRDGYQDLGQTRDLTSTFTRFRSNKSEMSDIERVKLQRRLITLMKGISDHANENYNQSNILAMFSSTLSLRNSTRLRLEKSLIPWQDESTVTNCPLCLQSFGYILRKHHCRGCGTVVCGDNMTNCSKSFGLSELKRMAYEETANGGLNNEGSSPDSSGYTVLLCKRCSTSLVSHTLNRSNSNGNYHRGSPEVSLIFNKLQILLVLKQSVELYRSRLSQLISTIQTNNTASSSQLSQLELQRTRLTTNLKQYSLQTKELLTEIKPKSADQQALLCSIRQSSTEFIQETTSVLKPLPKLLKQISTANTNLPELGSGFSSLTPTPTPEPQSTSTASPYIQPPPTKPKISISEAHKIKELRETLLILNEQSFLIKGQIQNAIQLRKFDDLKILKANLQDLEAEMNSTRQELEKLGDVNEGL